MWIVSFLKRVISQLFGFFKRPSGRISLRPSGLTFFACDAGEVVSGACSVTALYEPDFKPAAGVAIRYRVIQGPLRFMPHGATEVKVNTDTHGKAAVDIEFTSKGSAIVVADLAGDHTKSVFFRIHSNGTTHNLFLYSDPVFPADPGLVKARIVALDHHNRPVVGAKLNFEGAFGLDTAVQGEVVELGNGEYEGRFQTHIAGAWTILVQDMDTRATADTCINVTPLEAHAIRLMGKTDPRILPPYGELLLRARLEDKFGNALDPHRIRCAAAGQLISPHALIEGEARFPVRLRGHGSIEVALSDSSSPVSHKAVIPFAAAWFSNPGKIIVGSKFRTTLYAAPASDRPLREATFRIDFNSKLVSFKTLEKPTEIGTPVSTTAKVEGNKLTIAMQAESDINADEYPDGIAICTIEWECLDEGESCFEVVAAMSPDGPMWAMCPIQKQEEIKKICVNVIHKYGELMSPDWLDDFKKIVNAHVELCCPLIDIEKEFYELEDSEWEKVNKAIGGDGEINSNKDFEALDKTKIGQKQKCINLYLIPFNEGKNKGKTIKVGGSTTAFDPNAVGVGKEYPYGIAHELGHALGLDHVEDPDPNNLMNNGGPKKDPPELNDEQCEEIWENIDKYTR